MSCHVCNAVNSAMSARCMQCHTVLIPEAMPRSKEAQQGENHINAYIAEAYGALAGFVVASAAWMTFSGQDDALKSYMLVGVFTGCMVGKAVARYRRR